MSHVIIDNYFLEYFLEDGGTPKCVQGSLLSLSSRIIPGGFEGSFGMPGD